MKNIGKLTIILIFSSIVLSNLVYSQSEEDARQLSYLGLGYGARALGLGTAFTAVANDFSAVYWNPAGLGQIGRNEVSLGLSYASFNNDATLFGTKESFSNSSTNLNAFGLVYPFPVRKGNLVFAIGYGKQTDFTSALGFNGFNFKSSTVSYPDNIQINGKILRGGGINNWVAAGAVEAAPNLFIGASLTFISGSYTYTRDYLEDDIDNNYYLYQYIQKYTIDEDIGGFTARVGILHEFANKQGRIGFNIKFPSYLSMRDNYSEDQQFLQDNPALDSLDYYSGISEFDIVSPFVFSGGISWRFGDLMLSVGADYTDWTQMEFKNTYADLMQENTVIKEDMQPTVNLRTGAEFAIPGTDLEVRGGFAYLPSPYVFDASPKDQKYITGGLGWIVENSFKFDIGYAYGWWETDHVIEYATTAEKIQTHTILATVSYRF
jgi:long-subunit fatty acid transport protein